MSIWADRVTAIADAVARLGYDGITAFDRAEPEYRAFQTLTDRYDDPALVGLLGVCAGTADTNSRGTPGTSGRHSKRPPWGTVTSRPRRISRQSWRCSWTRQWTRLNQPVSMLRLDSIVWQPGQVIGSQDPDREAATAGLLDHFEDVDLQQSDAERLAAEFVAAM